MRNERTNQRPAVPTQVIPCSEQGVGGKTTLCCECQPTTLGATPQRSRTSEYCAGGPPYHPSPASHDPIISNRETHDQDRDQVPLATASPTPKLLLTVEEAAQQLSVGRPKMYQLVMRGEVLSIKIGASRRIPATAVQEYVQRLCDTAETELHERRNRYGH